MILEYIKSHTKDELSDQELKDRTLEIKHIINTLEKYTSVKVKTICKISTYKSSFNHYLSEFNEQIESKRKFSFDKLDQETLIIRRIGDWTCNKVKASESMKVVEIDIKMYAQQFSERLQSLKDKSWTISLSTVTKKSGKSFFGYKGFSNIFGVTKQFSSIYQLVKHIEETWQ